MASLAIVTLVIAVMTSAAVLGTSSEVLCQAYQS